MGRWTQQRCAEGGWVRKEGGGWRVRALQSNQTSMNQFGMLQSLDVTSPSGIFLWGVCRLFKAMPHWRAVSDTALYGHASLAHPLTIRISPLPLWNRCRRRLHCHWCRPIRRCLGSVYSPHPHTHFLFGGSRASASDTASLAVLGTTKLVALMDPSFDQTKLFLKINV